MAKLEYWPTVTWEPLQEGGEAIYSTTMSDGHFYWWAWAELCLETSALPVWDLSIVLSKAGTAAPRGAHKGISALGFSLDYLYEM